MLLQGICGVEPGPGYDGVSYTLSILCLAHTLVLGFNSRDALLAWDARVRYSLGEGQWLGLVRRSQSLFKDVMCQGSMWERWLTQLQSDNTHKKIQLFYYQASFCVRMPESCVTPKRGGLVVDLQYQHLLIGSYLFKGVVGFIINI